MINMINKLKFLFASICNKCIHFVSTLLEYSFYSSNNKYYILINIISSICLGIFIYFIVQNISFNSFLSMLFLTVIFFLINYFIIDKIKIKIKVPKFITYIYYKILWFFFLLGVVGFFSLIFDLDLFNKLW